MRADLESSPVTSFSSPTTDGTSECTERNELLRQIYCVVSSSAREWDVPRKRGGCGIAKEGKNGRRSRLHSLCGGGGDLLYSDMAPFAQEDLFPAITGTA